MLTIIFTIIQVLSIVLTVFTVLHILGSTALGLRKSWKHSLIRLCRNVAAILLAFVTAKLISAPISSLVGNLINGYLGAVLGEMPTLLGFISGVPGAILMPFIFVILFWVYTLLLLIPQIFVKKAVLKDEIAAKKEKRKPDIPWSSRFISAGIKFANAIIVVLIVMLPLSCLLSVADNAYLAVEDVVASFGIGEESAEGTPDDSSHLDIYDEAISPITNNPVIVAASNPLSRVIYSNLSEIRVGETVCYLDQELLSICDVLGNVGAFTGTEISEYGEDQKTAIKNIASYVSQSEFRCTLLAELMVTVMPDVGETEEGGIESSILDIFAKATPESLSADLDALADTVGVLIDHEIFAMFSEENVDADPNALLDKLGGKEFLADLLTAVNPSKNCRNIVPTIIHLALSEVTGEETAGEAPILEELTAEQIEKEAAAISDTIMAFKEATESAPEEGTGAIDSISSINMGAFGKVYDRSQDSLILKDNVKELFVSLLKSEMFEGLGAIADILSNHIENDPNLQMTKVLTATQQLAKIFSRYQSGNSATNMVDLKNDLSSLINSVDHNTADILNEIIASDAFASTSLAGGADSKTTKLLTSVINNMIEMENLSDEEVEREAKAIDYLMKISNSKSESVNSVFDGEGDNSDEMMDTILNSQISVSAINEIAYDEEGNLTGDALELSENLSEEDKEDVHVSAENYYKENVGNMTEEEKETLKKNMNAIAAIFGNDLTADFPTWDAEIAG